MSDDEPEQLSTDLDIAQEQMGIRRLKAAQSIDPNQYGRYEFNPPGILNNHVIVVHHESDVVVKPAPPSDDLAALWTDVRRLQNQVDLIVKLLGASPR